MVMFENKLSFMSILEEKVDCICSMENKLCIGLSSINQHKLWNSEVY